MYRFLLITSGILLIVFGATIYFNATLTQAAVEGGFCTDTIRLCLLLSALFLALAGLLAIFTAISRLSAILLLANFIGEKLVTFSLLLFVGFVFTSSSVAFAPFWGTLAASLKLSAVTAAKIPLISVTALACTVWMFHTGITIAENGGRMNAIIVTHIITFLLLVVMFLPLCSMLEIPPNITVFPFAVFVTWFMIVFMGIRSRAGHSIAKLILLTILCVILFAVYYYAITLLYNSKIGFLFEWEYFSLALFVLALLCVGYNGNHHHQKIGISYCKYCKKEINGWHNYCSTHCQNAANIRTAIDRVEHGNAVHFDDGNSLTFDNV